jgi:cytosine/adenosine deaminase-related metal-dependent hydrolase
MNWLKVLYPMWARIRPDDLILAIQSGLAELALSGCTTPFDHQYIFPNGCTLDHAIHAACTIGLRFHASRSSMSLGASKGGLPPDRCVEREPMILKDSQRVMERYHDSKPGAMLQISLAPCSPFSVIQGLMVESARMARHYVVGLHTHLAESLEEERYTLNKYQLRSLMEKLGWVGPDVWFAHSVHINNPEIKRYSETGCGVAHCPCSNMRLASGIAPIKQFRDAGVRVGIGVDGASSNDGTHVLDEARQAMLLARTLLSQYPGGPPTEQQQWMSARDALEMATRRGAAILRRTDIGSLEIGKCTDFFAVNLNTIGFSGGAQLDPFASLVFTAPPSASYTVVHGRFIVKERHLTTLDPPRVIDACNRAAIKVING